MSPTPTSPPEQPNDDALLQRYQEANALDSARPDPALRSAVIAHARATALSPATTPAPADGGPPEARDAANDSQWRWRALGSIAVLGLVGLLVLQFERGTPEERAAAFGTAAPRHDAPAEPATLSAEQRSTAAATATLPATEAPRAAPPALPDAIAPPAVRSPAAKKAQAEQPAAAMNAAEPETAVAPAQAETPEAFTEAPRPKAAAPVEAAPAMAPAAPAAPMASAGSAAPGQATAKALRRSAPTVGSSDKQSGAVSDLAVAPAAGTALLAATAQGNLKAVQQLLESGIDIETRDALGRTPLMIAAKGSNRRVLEALLDAGADPDARDAAGLTAADHAQFSGHPDWVPLLQTER